MKQYSMYHKFLRVFAVVFTLVLLFESGVLSKTTAQISQNTHQYLASAIGMSASVQPTELNKFTAQLTEKERDLDAREASLREREISVDLSTGGEPGNDTATYVLASILFILLVLILLNYTLDYLRLRESRAIQTV